MSRLIEGFSSDQAEPTAESHCDFDFDAVSRALGEAIATPEDSAKFARALSGVLDWLLKVDLNDHRALKTIGKRAIAMAWVLDPDRFKVGDARQSPSLRQLSKQLGFTAPTISPITSEFSRITKIFNKFQSHDWRREKQHEFAKN